MVDSLTSGQHGLLWLVPLLPLAAAGLLALLSDARGRMASAIATAALVGSALLAIIALTSVIHPAEAGGVMRSVSSFTWFTIGDQPLRIGLLLDPLSAGMGAMVTFVAFWIFLYSRGYMMEEKRFGRFFTFLSLFCGAILLAVYANNLLLLFVAWELVGLASYLLIGFYFDKPAAAAAAQKAFITTRVGDMAFFIGMIWLHSSTGTLLFYDDGNGLLESGALASLAGATTLGGLSISAAASLLILIGAMGKSGQVPLHTWLPDAMEGPTPVSALIHAATMVAAGVFLVARTHPIFAADGETGIALTAAAWVGAVTALYASLVAMAQYDIKRILAYSTVSQLGFMMIALGTGGVAAAMFHLIAHAFFKALLFLSAGSVIHGCDGEQDIRRMGGLRKTMPLTFATYAVGMMALAGFPFVFSGFWSKEAIFHSAESWPGGRGPFFIAVGAACLTAFYMTRQALLVFFAKPREGSVNPHESPSTMTIPLVVLAAATILLSVVGTPVWPWFECWITGEQVGLDVAGLTKPGTVTLIVLSLVIVVIGVIAACRFYAKPSMDFTTSSDPLAPKLGGFWRLLERAMGFDELYRKMVIGPLSFIAGGVDAMERMMFAGSMGLGERMLKRFGKSAGSLDESAINPGFDRFCQGVDEQAQSTSRSQSGKPQAGLRAIGLAMAVSLVLYLWFSSR
jgi:NADH-quinone oxidoreductase subunit L